MNKEYLIEKLKMIIDACDASEDHLLEAIIKLRHMRTESLKDLEGLEDDE